MSSLCASVCILGPLHFGQVSCGVEVCSGVIVHSGALLLTGWLLWHLGLVQSAVQAS